MYIITVQAHNIQKGSSEDMPHPEAVLLLYTLTTAEKIKHTLWIKAVMIALKL